MKNRWLWFVIGILATMVANMGAISAQTVGIPADQQIILLEKNKEFGRAMWFAQRDMNIAPGRPVCDQAKAMFNAMLPAYTKMLDDVKATIKKGNAAAFNQAIIKFAHIYMPYAQTDELMLRREATHKQLSQ